MARDRSEAYGAGIRQGDPEATQVADLFHLWQNLVSALQEVFSTHHCEIANLNNVTQNEARTRDDGAGAVPVAPPVATSRAQQQIKHNRARRVAEDEQVRGLHQQGWTIKAIAAHVGRNRRTVKKCLQASTFPERQPRWRRHPPLLTPYKAYLLERWNASWHRAHGLCRKIQSQGFRGQYSVVANSVSRFRPAQGRVSNPPPTLDTLQTLRLTGIYQALVEQLHMPAMAALTFKERLRLLVNRELTERENRRLTHALAPGEAAPDGWHRR
jgi:transposase